MSILGQFLRFARSRPDFGNTAQAEGFDSEGNFITRFFDRHAEDAHEYKVGRKVFVARKDDVALFGFHTTDYGRSDIRLPEEDRPTNQVFVGPVFEIPENARGPEDPAYFFDAAQGLSIFKDLLKRTKWSRSPQAEMELFQRSLNLRRVLLQTECVKACPETERKINDMMLQEIRDFFSRMATRIDNADNSALQKSLIEQLMRQRVSVFTDHFLRSSSILHEVNSVIVAEIGSFFVTMAARMGNTKDQAELFEQLMANRQQFFADPLVISTPSLGLYINSIAIIEAGEIFLNSIKRLHETTTLEERQAAFDAILQLRDSLLQHPLLEESDLPDYMDSLIITKDGIPDVTATYINGFEDLPQYRTFLERRHNSGFGVLQDFSLER